MKARQVIAAFLCGTALTAFAAFPRTGFSSKELSAAPAPVPVQGCPDRGQSIMLVAVFGVEQGQVDSMGMIAADTLRDQIARRMCREFFPRPKGDMEQVLNQSAFSTTKALPQTDLKLLASTLSADIVVMGKVSVPKANDWSMTPRLMDPTDAWIQEPLPTVKGRSPKFIAEPAMGHIREAAKIVPEYRKCRGAWNAGKYDEAIAAAKAALAIFPQSLMARVCMGMALEGAKATPDTILAIAKQVLAVNPRDYHAIRLREGAERAKGNKDTANALLIDLLTLNPTDVPLQEKVIREFAEAGNYEQALKMAASAKAANPGQSDILALEGLICYAAAKFDCAIAAYDEIAQMGDTASQTVQYFERLSSSHQKSGNPRQAANVIARGAAKFADTTRLHIMHGQFLREAGDTVGAVAAGRKALALDPTLLDTYIQIAAVYGQNVDSLISVLSAALPHAKTSADSAKVANMVIAPGQKLFTATAEVARDTTKATDADFEQFNTVIRMMEFAEKAVPESASPPGKQLPRFYAAFSHAQLGLRYLTIAHKTQAADPVKTCQMATQAYERLTKGAKIMEEGAATVSREAGIGVIQMAQSNQGLLADLKTTFCKAGI